MSTEEKPSLPLGLDTYKPSERLLYRYFDGKNEVVADPLVLHKKLMDIATELDSDLKAAGMPGWKKADEAYDSAINKLRTIFKILPMEEGGLTPTECEELLDHFLTYADWVKKNWRPTRTSVMVTSRPSEPLQAGDLPTQNTSDSTSTETEHYTVEQKQPPLGLELPTAISSQAWSIGVPSPAANPPQQ